MLKLALKRFTCSAILIFLAIVSYCQSSKVLEIKPHDDDEIYVPIEKYITVLPDPGDSLTIVRVSDPSFAEKFRPNVAWLSSPIKTHWLRLVVKSDLATDKELLSYIQGSVVDLYQQSADHTFTKKHSGLLVPITDRDQKGRFGHLPFISLLIMHGSTQTYYWRINNNNFPSISPHTNQEASLSSFEYILQKTRGRMFFFTAICSILFGLALYHLVIFLVTRDKVYFYFIIYSLASCLYIMYYKGYLLEFVFQQRPGLHYTFAFAFVCIAFHIALLGYVRQYLDLKINFPTWDRFLLIVFSVIVVIVVLTSFTNIQTPPFFLNVVLTFPMIVLEILGFVLLSSRHLFAWNYLVAFTLLLVGTIANGIFSFLGIEQGVWDLGDIGILGLQVLLAAGLALRINSLNKEKQIAQTELIKQLKENQTLQDTITVALEAKVSERTKEVEHQNEKLSRLNLLKDKLFSIISHDIKGPLNQLSSTLYMMERDMITKEEIRILVPQIRTNLSANTNFINELLTWAKSQLEGAKLNPQAANLQELIDSNFQLLKPIADAKGIQLTSRLSNPVCIFADVEMIKSVVRNLSANAIKFTNPKGRIEIEVDVDNSFASISINDNGKGISAENQKKLFGSQIFTTPGTANEKGTGLGLLLCKDFVEKNGGRIWVESEEGRGSKFAFTVPLNKN